MEYYSAIKRNTRVNSNEVKEPRAYYTSEVNQEERNKYHILMHTYTIQKNDTEEFICRAAVEKQT